MSTRPPYKRYAELFALAESYAQRAASDADKARRRQLPVPEETEHYIALAHVYATLALAVATDHAVDGVGLS